MNLQQYRRGQDLRDPELTAVRLHRELGELGYRGGQAAVKDFLRTVRPSPAPGFEVRFETHLGAKPQPGRGQQDAPAGQFLDQQADELVRPFSL